MRYFYGAAFFRAHHGGFEDLLGFEGVFEIGERGDGGLAAEEVEHVGGLVDEGVFVADGVGVGPPGGGVGVIGGVADVDAAPAGGFAGFGAAEEAEPGEVFEVDGDRPFFAVNLDAVFILISGGKSRGFKRTDRAAFEAGQKKGGVVDVYFAFSGFGAGDGATGEAAVGALRGEDAFLDEGFGDGAGDFGDFVAGDESGHVDDVGAEVTVGAAAGNFFAEAPDEGDFGAGPVLEVVGADVVDAAEAAFFDELVGEGDGGDAAVGVPDERFALFGFFGGVAHLAGVAQGGGKGLFAGDVFAGFEGGEGDVEVLVVGGGDVDEVDVRIGDGVFPVCGCVLPAPAGFEGFEGCGVAGADGVHDGVAGEVEEFRGFEEGVAVGAAHEFLADEADGCGELVHRSGSVRGAVAGCK